MFAYCKQIADNRKARFDYTILETYKAGLVLLGSEIKAIRLGQVNLKDSFARVDKGGIWVYGLHITPYAGAGQTKINAVRPRKLLLKKREMVKLIGKVAEKGLTLVPLKIVIEGNWAKLEIGLAKAKRKFEKRDTLRRREVEKEIKAAFKGKIHGS